VLILSSLLDMLILPMPYQIADRQWQIDFVSQVVDRGIVPLIGVILLLIASWIDSVAGLAGDRKKVLLDPSLWALIISSILGLVFLIMIPLHLNNVRVSQAETIDTIQQEAAKAETQLGSRLQTEIDQQKQQLQQLLDNPEQLNQALNSGAIPEEQSKLLRQFQSDRGAFDTYIKKRVDELRNQFQTEIGVRRETALKGAKTNALKSSLRIGFGSLILSSGFILIGWLGLRNLGTIGQSKE